MKPMPSVYDAKQMILAAQQVGDIESVSVVHALGRVLAQDVLARVDLPPFTASAMDGFAVKACDVSHASNDPPVRLSLCGAIPAGTNPDFNVTPKTCARIMTGAILPQGADAVVMREDTETTANDVLIKKSVTTGKNVRLQGEEVRAGTQILTRETTLTPASLALIASSGVDKISVFQKPKVALITTGSELASPGQDLSAAKIYESNSTALHAALLESGFDATVFPNVPDDAAALTQTFRHALKDFTHVIITGGVSVGDYDCNKAVLADLGVTTLLWRVAQKPGKPLFVGTHEQALVFGLPGNPASALVCFYEYALPALQKFCGQKDLGLDAATATLETDVVKKPGLTHFLRGTAQFDGQKCVVSTFTRQESHMMSSFAAANCLVVLDAQTEILRAGDVVTVHLLPHARVFQARSQERANVVTKKGFAP